VVEERGGEGVQKEEDGKGEGQGRPWRWPETARRNLRVCAQVNVGPNKPIFVTVTGFICT